MATSPRRSLARRAVPLAVLAVLVLTGAYLGAGGVTSALGLSRAPSAFPAPLYTRASGRVAFSSPTVATIDGVTAIVTGSLTGEISVINAETGAELPGWPRQVEIAPGKPSAIDSSPTVADLDGPHSPPSIIVGAGSLFVHDQQGGLEAFNANGTVRFIFHTLDAYNEWTGGPPAGYDNAVISTPAVGSLTKSGQQDIVFGSLDHRIYALNNKGALLPGFPINNADTIWSSPALADISHNGVDDLFIGGDASGRAGCRGGFVMAYRYAGRAPVEMWQRCLGEVVWSSPAIGILRPGGPPALVVGTGWVYKDPAASNRIYGFDAASGVPLPGWPIVTSGPTYSSPAIGDLGGRSGPRQPDVVFVSCGPASASCAEGPSRVSAVTGTGRPLWSTQLSAQASLSSPILVPLRGEKTNDVVVGSALGTYLVNGATGSFLYGTRLSPLEKGCAVENSAAVLELPGRSWRLVIYCGGPVSDHSTLALYRLPLAPGAPPGWPMWREGPTHDGVANS